MTGNGPGKPSCLGNPFVVLLLLEKAQQAATGHQVGWSQVSPPVLQSSCSALHFSAGALRPGRISRPESRMDQGKKSKKDYCLTWKILLVLLDKIMKYDDPIFLKLLF